MLHKSTSGHQALHVSGLWSRTGEAEADYALAAPVAGCGAASWCVTSALTQWACLALTATTPHRCGPEAGGSDQTALYILYTGGTKDMPVVASPCTPDHRLEDLSSCSWTLASVLSIDSRLCKHCCLLDCNMSLASVLLPTK